MEIQEIIGILEDRTKGLRNPNENRLFELCLLKILFDLNKELHDFNRELHCLNRTNKLSCLKGS